MLVDSTTPHPPTAAVATVAKVIVPKKLTTFLKVTVRKTLTFVVMRTIRSPHHLPRRLSASKKNLMMNVVKRNGTVFAVLEVQIAFPREFLAHPIIPSILEMMTLHLIIIIMPSPTIIITTTIVVVVAINKIVEVPLEKSPRRHQKSRWR